VQKHISNRCQFLAVFLFSLSFGEAQNLIIPQIADGGGWQTTLVITNTSPSPATANLTFFQETAGSNTQNWNLVFLETSSPQSVSLPAAGTVFLHTAGTAGTTSVGWAQLAANSSVNAYAIFTQRVPGRQDQDGTAQAAASSSRVLIPYDNTNGFVTSVALANTTSSSQSLTVGIQPSTGASSQPVAITLPGQGHTSFTIPQQFPTTAGHSGLLELTGPTISLSALALRFNPTGGFTTAPVYPESGTPIIAANSGTQTLPKFVQISILATPVPNPLAIANTIQIQVGAATSPTNYTQGSISGFGSSTSINYSAQFNNITVSGQTLTFGGLFVGGSLLSNGTGSANITSGSVTVALTPVGVVTSGTATGMLNFVSASGTVTQSFTGTYSAAQ